MSFGRVYPIEALSHVRPVLNYDEYDDDVFDDENENENNVLERRQANNIETNLPTVNTTNLPLVSYLVPRITFYTSDENVRQEEEPAVPQLSKRPHYLSMRKFLYKNWYLFFILFQNMYRLSIVRYQSSDKANI